MSTIYLVSHAGTLHADDILSTVFLKKYFSTRYDKVICVRTSDLSSFCKDEQEPLKEEITTTSKGQDSIIYDTGKGLFDHHQKGARVRSNGITYSSFGLLWERFGLEYLSDTFPDATFSLTDVYDIFERDFVMGVDAYDNGEKPEGIMNNISGILARLRPNWDSNEEAAKAYRKMTKGLAEAMFDIEIEKAVSNARATTIVRAAVDAAIDEAKRYVVFSQYVPHEQYILSDPLLDHILYTIFPSNHTEGEWAVMALPVQIGKFETRKPLPKPLRAAPRDELMKKNWTFVHASGFLGSALTLDDAIRLAEYAIRTPINTVQNILTVKEPKFSKMEFSELRNRFISTCTGVFEFGYTDDSHETIIFLAEGFKDSITDGNFGLILDPEYRYHITYIDGHFKDKDPVGYITKR